MTNITPRSASAASRSPTADSRTSSRPPCARTDSMVYSRVAPPRAGLPRRIAPGAKRWSGSSVRTSTTTSPVTPCALTTRPTTSSMSRLLSVGVHHIDADPPAADAGDQRPQCGGGAAAAVDDLAEIVGMDVHLDGAAPTVGHHVDADVVGVVDDPTHQMLNGVNNDRTHRRVSFRLPRRPRPAPPSSQPALPSRPAPPPSSPALPSRPAPPPSWPALPSRPAPPPSSPALPSRPAPPPSWPAPSSSSAWWPRWLGPRRRPVRR